MHNAINDYVEQSIETKDDSMTCPDINKYCLVKSDDGFDRGKIIEVNYTEDESYMRIFLVDIGEIRKCDISNVYDIPDDLIQKFPFQVCLKKRLNFTLFRFSLKKKHLALKRLKNKYDE